MQEALRNINSQILSPRDKFFLKKKDEAFSQKNSKIHRTFRDSFATKVSRV